MVRTWNESKAERGTHGKKASERGALTCCRQAVIVNFELQLKLSQRLLEPRLFPSVQLAKSQKRPVWVAGPVSS